MKEQAKGVTLIELIITISVLAIFAAIAVPNFMEYLPKSRANGAARELFTQMQLARMKAISDNNDYVIVFNTGNDSYTIYNDEDNNGPDPGEAVKTINIQDNFTGIGFGYVPGNNPSGNPITSEVTFSSDRVAFKATGLANAGGVYLIPTVDIAASRKDRQRALTVILTGRVRLWAHTGTGSVWN